MKKAIVITVISAALIAAVVLICCSKADDKYTYGTVMRCTNGTVMILTDCGGAYRTVEPIVMSAADKDDSIFDGLVTGDKIKIEIVIIEELFPAHTYVYSLEKTGSGNLDDIPAELLERLEEMGYTAR